MNRKVDIPEVMRLYAKALDSITTRVLSALAKKRFGLTESDGLVVLRLIVASQVSTTDFWDLVEGGFAALGHTLRDWSRSHSDCRTKRFFESRRLTLADAWRIAVVFDEVAEKLTGIRLEVDPASRKRLG